MVVEARVTFTCVAFNVAINRVVAIVEVSQQRMVP